ncbi:MAG: phosphoribosylanthranilate isomerase, partial [Spirochaetaceae bacterium]|nr:phosphoribosylanthranilate isomerase [Spirochaetaceae bacterium]
RLEDIRYANRARPDYIGFVFAESKRRVTAEKARELREKLDAGITPVGVFVNAEIENIAALVNGRVIDMVQLHGNEDRAYISRLRETCAAPIIKAVRLGHGEHPPEDADLRTAYGADYILLDSGAGSGITFDWRIVERWTAASDFGNAFFLAGGINGNNIHRAVALAPFCVDVSSGAETDGAKDIEKMTALTASCRGYGM